MSTQYFCQQTKRRNLVRLQKNPVLNGIDYLEVVSAAQPTLQVHFLFPLPGQASGVPSGPKLTPSNIVIQGGVRIKGLSVTSVTATGSVLSVQVNASGDFSTYTLLVVADASDPVSVTGDPIPPAGFDPQLASVEFSFHAVCATFDCQQIDTCPPPSYPTAQIDYLAKDYASFRQLVLDRLALTMPNWQERHSADIGIVLVELLAYAGDQLSYYQDAVATEAYLGTARQRISVRRHARLLDYFMHDGCNARAWILFQGPSSSPWTQSTAYRTGQLVLNNGLFYAATTAGTSASSGPGPTGTGAAITDGSVVWQYRTVDPTAVPQQTMLVTQTGAPPGLLKETDLAAAVTAGGQVFQTMFDLTVHAELNELQFYTWSDDECCLPRGATSATLVDNGAGTLLVAALKPNSPTSGVVYLLFEEVLGPATGAAADADPTHRQVVRLIQAVPGSDPLTGTGVVEIVWDPGDALLFPLCISIAGQQNPVSVARGNVALADHGMSQLAEPLPPLPTNSNPLIPFVRPLYRPRLSHLDLTFGTEYDPTRAALQPAAGALVQDPSRALPLIALTGEGNPWTPLPDLLSSTSTATNFVVEMENDGGARLRFGDGTFGRAPVGGLSAIYRTGNGLEGNVGAESIINFVGTPAVPLTQITAVRNPLPAQGGVAGETLDAVRANTPWAFRTQQRAVTVADYAACAERHTEVKKAQATLRWTGSWYTMFVTVERILGRPVDANFCTVVRNFMEQFRLAGYDLEIEAPIYVPLDIAFTVCVAPGYFRSDVEAALLQTFSDGILPNGQPGFFDPDNFTFGQPVYLSQVVAAAMQVPGVRWVDTNDISSSFNHFKRWGQASQGETQAGKIVMARLEIARLDNDPNQPENGKIAFLMEGGQ